MQGQNVRASIQIEMAKCSRCQSYWKRGLIVNNYCPDCLPKEVVAQNNTTNTEKQSNETK